MSPAPQARTNGTITSAHKPFPSRIRKRDGKTVQSFDLAKIENAIQKAWLEADPTSLDPKRLTLVALRAADHLPGEEVHIEQVQDAVEKALMGEPGLFPVAKAYIIYRQRRADERRREPQRHASDRAMSTFAATITSKRYAHEDAEGGREDWRGVARRVAHTVLGAVDAPETLKFSVEEAIYERKLLPGGRYLAATGRAYHQVQNCLLLRPEDSREGWGDHLQKVTLASMTGAGLGAVYSGLREKGTLLRRTGGMASGPIPLMLATNEVGRAAQQGGDRRAALWAGLHWWHAQCEEFIELKQWAPEIRIMKARDFSAPAPMDHTNISVILDDEFFQAYENPEDRLHEKAHRVFWRTVRLMCETGEPGFSVNLGKNRNETLRNACTEVTSEDDSDICNLASINLARVRDKNELRYLVNLATAFLVAGTVYSDVPYGKVADVRAKNRRLGLGLMGMHEWLLQRGKRYDVDPDLEALLRVYAGSTESARAWAERWGLSAPVKTRAIAPNGTIGIVAETTGGIEPIFCVAMLRRYHDKGTWRQQYVVDPTAERLIQNGVSPDEIEDAYTLAASPERRVAFQAWVQQFVDHAISSTVNMPAWGTPHNNEDTVRPFGEMLLRHLPRLRGITVYPDGARDGQPLVRVPYAEAAANLGRDTLVAGTDVCDITKGSSCG